MQHAFQLAGRERRPAKAGGRSIADGLSYDDRARIGGLGDPAREVHAVAVPVATALVSLTVGDTGSNRRKTVEGPGCRDQVHNRLEQVFEILAREHDRITQGLDQNRWWAHEARRQVLELSRDAAEVFSWQELPELRESNDIDERDRYGARPGKSCGRDLGDADLLLLDCPAQLRFERQHDQARGSRDQLTCCCCPSLRRVVLGHPGSQRRLDHRRARRSHDPRDTPRDDPVNLGHRFDRQARRERHSQQTAKLHVGIGVNPDTRVSERHPECGVGVSQILHGHARHLGDFLRRVARDVTVAVSQEPLAREPRDTVPGYGIAELLECEAILEQLAKESFAGGSRSPLNAVEQAGGLEVDGRCSGGAPTGRQRLVRL